MKMCQTHWDICRAAINERGMWELVPKGAEEVINNSLAELRGEEARFDPLMSMNNHWAMSALENGGLSLMVVDMAAYQSNQGHRCPLCLRHTAATHMARRGVPLFKIAKILGNSIRVVESVYAKYVPEDLRAAVDTISGDTLEAAE